MQSASYVIIYLLVNVIIERNTILFQNNFRIINIFIHSRQPQIYGRLKPSADLTQNKIKQMFLLTFILLYFISLQICGRAEIKQS